MGRFLVVAPLLLVACSSAEPHEELTSAVEALRAATEQLEEAQVAAEADRAAILAELKALRAIVQATHDELERRGTERSRPERPLPSSSRFPSTLGTSRRPEPEEIEDIEAAIRCESDERCTVERSFVDSVLANPAQLARQARVVPSMRDGETLGYKLYGIRRGSIPSALGIKNGDLVSAVNGAELRTLDDAMEVYTKLRRASELVLSIERRGVSRTLTIEMVGGT